MRAKQTNILAGLLLASMILASCESVEEDFPEVYKWIDKNFEIYRSSYTIKVGKEDCDKIRGYVEKIVKRYAI